METLRLMCYVFYYVLFPTPMKSVHVALCPPYLGAGPFTFVAGTHPDARARACHQAFQRPVRPVRFDSGGIAPRKSPVLYNLYLMGER